MKGEKEKFIYEYCTLRYVPDIERGEFVNVGLMMMCKRLKWMNSRVHVDADRINALKTGCDISLLQRQINIFTDGDVPSKDIPTEEKYRWLAAVKSAIIQTSPSHPGIVYAEKEEGISVLEKKFDSLFYRLVWL